MQGRHLFLILEGRSVSVISVLALHKNLLMYHFHHHSLQLLLEELEGTYITVCYDVRNKFFFGVTIIPTLHHNHDILLLKCYVFLFRTFPILFLKSFEGIEGTVDIASICGTTGLLLSINTGVPPLKIGYIVQTIKIKSNMPLPVAP
jgi:hypothetical protein